MQIQVSFGSDVGRMRQINEDHCLVDAELRLYIVCDGMGGHAAGDVASRTATREIHRLVRQNADILSAIDRGEQPIEMAANVLRDAIERASRTIYDLGQSDQGRSGMGTTCSALLVRGGKGIMGHVGDSRLYLVREGQLHQLSEDHTFVQEAIRCGMLTPEQARESEHHNIVTRAVGPLERVLVDTLVFDLLIGDTLLLCSDGLHNYLGDGQELPGWLSTQPVESIPAQLIGVANERGGSDNITAVVVRASTQVLSQESEEARSTVVNQTFDTLRHVDLFSELSMPELVRVSNACRSIDLRRGETVIREGEISETLFIIVHGSVAISRGGAQVAELIAGSHFGEMALLSQRPRSASVSTREETRLLALDRPQLQTLLQYDAVLAGKFLWKLAQTLSLRLDDFYLFHEETQGLRQTTLRVGLYPSPFSQSGRG